MRKKGMRGGKTVAKKVMGMRSGKKVKTMKAGKKVMGMRSGKKVAKKKMRMGGSTSRASTPTGGRQAMPDPRGRAASYGQALSSMPMPPMMPSKQIPQGAQMLGMSKGKKVKKMKAGGQCRGMGAATKGGNFEVV